MSADVSADVRSDVRGGGAGFATLPAMPYT